MVEAYDRRADDIQQQQLRSLIRTARYTEWGQRYGYADLSTYTDFANRVPIQTYDTLKPSIQRMIDGAAGILWPGVVRWFAKSSGTTNDHSKFIPVTPAILRQCHYRGGYDVLGLYLRNYPDSRFFTHRGLVLGGSHSPSPLNRHARCGDLSAVLLQQLPAWINTVRVPSKQIILMDEWEAKIEAIVAATCRADVGNLSGIPSWMLTLIQAVLDHTGRDVLTDVWPNLEVFFHGGISFEPYRARYRELIPSPQMRYMETYNASEGFFGIQDDPSQSALLLMLDYGIFYEFIPIDTPGSQLDAARAIPLVDVEPGRNYALVITTAGGLWRYCIGDTVRFTSVRPYKFIISGRTKHFINAFGEELMVDNAERGLQQACQATGAAVRSYTAAPLFDLDHTGGCHQWLIEFETLPTSIPAFAEALDRALQTLNSDYEAKRYKAISLQPPQIVVARERLFFDWLKSRGKLGGQHKVPPLGNDRTLMDELLRMNDRNER